MATASVPFNAPVAALLEIGRDAKGEIPYALISAAYRASRRKPVMLVLDSVTPKEIDAVLDPLVSSNYREHRGVIYAQASDDRAVLAGAASASHVFAASQRLMDKLLSWGIPFEDLAHAEPVLSGNS